MRKFGNCIIHERSRCQLTREDFHRLHWHVFMVIKENKLCLFYFHLENCVCDACESSLVSDGVNSEHVHTPFIWILQNLKRISKCHPSESLSSKDMWLQASEGWIESRLYVHVMITTRVTLHATAEMRSGFDFLTNCYCMRWAAKFQIKFLLSLSVSRPLGINSWMCIC